MKKTKIISLFLFVGFIFLFSGCASNSTTQGSASTIEEAHPERFEKTVIGMDINEFKAVWPEATRSGFSENGETYEFIYTHLFLYGYDYKIYTYFYFTNNKLVKYESTKRTGL